MNNRGVNEMVDSRDSGDKKANYRGHVIITCMIPIVLMLLPTLLPIFVNIWKVIFYFGVAIVTPLYCIVVLALGFLIAMIS